jgi:hypothetical protein
MRAVADDSRNPSWLAAALRNDPSQPLQLVRQASRLPFGVLRLLEHVPLERERLSALWHVLPQALAKGAGFSCSTR